MFSKPATHLRHRLFAAHPSEINVIARHNRSRPADTAETMDVDSRVGMPVDMPPDGLKQLHNILHAFRCSEIGNRQRIATDAGGRQLFVRQNLSLLGQIDKKINPEVEKQPQLTQTYTRIPLPYRGASDGSCPLFCNRARLQCEPSQHLAG